MKGSTTPERNLHAWSFLGESNHCLHLNIAAKGQPDWWVPSGSWWHFHNTLWLGQRGSSTRTDSCDPVKALLSDGEFTPLPII